MSATRLLTLAAFLVRATVGESHVASGIEARQQNAAAQHHKRPPGYYHAVVIAHAVLACLAWVIVFPSGSILMRLLPGRYALKVHALFQGSGVAMYVASVGMGIWMGMTTSKLDNYHVILGLVIFGLVAFQVVAGVIHHWVLYKRTSQRSSLSRMHLWLGRLLITAGMINGGLGFKLASPDWRYGTRVASTGDLVAYGVLCGIFWLAYVLVIVYTEMRPERTVTPESDSDSDKLQAIKREMRSSKKTGQILDSDKPEEIKREMRSSRAQRNHQSQV